MYYVSLEACAMHKLKYRNTEFFGGFTFCCGAEFSVILMSPKHHSLMSSTNSVSESSLVLCLFMSSSPSTVGKIFLCSLYTSALFKLKTLIPI